MSAALVLSYRNGGKYAFNVLAGALEVREATRRVPIDFARSREELFDLARQRSAEGHRVIVAWSFYSPTFAEAAEEVAWLKSQLPDALCIAGGVHATAEPLPTLRAGFDLVAIGEGERTWVELVERVDAGLDGRGRGLGWLEQDRLVTGGRAEPVQLDDWPAFSVRHRKFGAIEITRGCIYACRFCQTPFMNRARFRHRSVENVARWARALAEANLRDVRFITPTSLSYGSPDERVNLEAVEALLSAVREAIGPNRRLYFGTFPSEVRPEHVTPEAMAVLERYVDNDNLIIGGQSGSERILKTSGRGHDVEAIERAVRVALEHGFQPNVDFIFGLPGEEPADVEATLALMRRLTEAGARVHGHTFMPLPGTPFKNAPPGRVDARTRRELERLASTGRMYGQWKRQAEVAAELARRRLP